MTSKWTTGLVALAVALSVPAASDAGGKSYRPPSYRTRRSASLNRSTVNVNATYRPGSQASAYRYGLATGAAQQALAQKAAAGYSDSVTMRTVRTVFGSNSRYGLVNGAGSVLAGNTTDPYVYRQRSELGRTVAGTAVMTRDMIKHVGKWLSR